LNSITSETDGFVVDLTPAILLNLGDGTALNQDQIFQVSFLVLPYLGLHNAQDFSQILYFASIKLQNIKCVGFYWHFHMLFSLSGCCVMNSKSSRASVNISLNSGSERK
jgi:hypothetical protein